MDETKLLISKIEDLADLCRKNYYPAFSRFLDMKQQTAVKNISAEGCRYSFYGGFDDAERKIAGCFPSGEEYGEDVFPIKVLEVLPSDCEGLTHRDYLGSVLGLGIKRDCIGDIVLEGNRAYVFCTEEICDYICLNLKRIGNRSLQVTETEPPEVAPKTFRRMSGTVASNRLDCVLAFALSTSRGQAAERLKEGKVTVNYTETESVTLRLKAGDTVSVRGFGKFVFVGESGSTKKGRLKIDLDIYT